MSTGPDFGDKGLQASTSSSLSEEGPFGYAD